VRGLGKQRNRVGKVTAEALDQREDAEDRKRRDQTPLAGIAPGSMLMIRAVSMIVNVIVLVMMVVVSVAAVTVGMAVRTRVARSHRAYGLRGTGGSGSAGPKVSSAASGLPNPS